MIPQLAGQDLNEWLEQLQAEIYAAEIAVNEESPDDQRH